MKKNDIILLASVLIVAGIILTLVLTVGKMNTGQTVVVTVDGEEYARLPLDKDAELTINGYGGGTNLLIIKDGKAYISEASCPDKVCVHTGAASDIKSIVCLPNRVMVYIEKS